MAETTGTVTTGDYENGSDVLLMVGDKCIGHCTSHEVNYNSETKEHSVKPLQSAAKTKALFKGKTVTGLSVSISFDGLVFTTESEQSIEALRAKWVGTTSIECKCFKRGEQSPYMSGKFVLSSLKESYPAQDDATYSGTLENDGAVTFGTTSDATNG